MPNDKQGRYYPPAPALVPAPGGVIEEVVEEQPEQEAPEQEQENKPGWEWVGSPSRPEAKGSSDGISDLFTVTEEDLDAGEGIDDLTSVDIEKDIIDADEDGSLDDLVSVTEDDIMGDDDYGQRPSKPASQQRKMRRRVAPRYQPPTSMGGTR